MAWGTIIGLGSSLLNSQNNNGGNEWLQDWNPMSSNYSNLSGKEKTKTYFKNNLANAATGGFWSKLFGKKNNNNGFQVYIPPEYQGLRPYSGDEVGYGSSEMKSLAGAYLPELKKRAMGEGLVGFDPKHRELLKSEYLTDYNDMYGDVMDETAAQASGQGLRGGVPMSIKTEKQKDLARAREAALAGIDLADLEARREDINKAFYQQPEEISRGAGIQNQRSVFDMAEYEAEQPVLIDQQQPQNNTISSLVGGLSTLAGAYLNNKTGNIASGNKSLRSAYDYSQYAPQYYKTQLPQDWAYGNYLKRTY